MAPTKRHTRARATTKHARRAPSKRTTRTARPYQGIHAWIDSRFSPIGQSAKTIAKYPKCWRDGSNLQCGRAVAGGLQRFVEKGVHPSRIHSATVKAILAFMQRAGYTMTHVESPVRSKDLRCATRIDLIATRGKTEYVIEIKVSALNAWSVPRSAATFRHIDVPNTPCNRAWIQAATGAAMYSSKHASDAEDARVIRPRVMHVYPKSDDKGFMVRFVPEPPWVRARLLPHLMSLFK